MRRLVACVIGAAILVCSASAMAQTFETIAPDLHLLRGAFSPGQQPDGNSVMLLGRKGWILVDSGRHETHTRALIRHAELSGIRITDIINTHWHLDHIAGNALVRLAYPRVEVHASGAIDDALNGFLANYRRQLVEAVAANPGSPEVPNWLAEIARIDSGARLRPTQPIIRDGHRELAARDLEIHLTTDAATDGDVWVYDALSRTLIAGDLVTLPVPFLDTACPSGWRKALDRLDDQHFTRLVPGHGPVLDRKQFRRYRIAFRGLLDCAATKADADRCGDGWIRDLGSVLPTSEHAQARELLDYYVTQRLRGPGATADCRSR